jgi:hypothetical protein
MPHSSHRLSGWRRFLSGESGPMTLLAFGRLLTRTTMKQPTNFLSQPS